MALAHVDYCPIHGQQNFLSHKCKQCMIEEEKAEEKRWESLTLEQRIEELRKEIEALKTINKPLG